MEIYDLPVITHRRAEVPQGEFFWNKETSSLFRILMKTCLLHCLLNSCNSPHFFVKNVQDYLIIYSLKYVITLTQSAFLCIPSNTDKSVQVLTVARSTSREKWAIIGWGWAWYHELSMPRSEASVDNINTRFYNSLTMIMFCYAFFNQPAKRGITRTTLNSTWYHVKRR